MTSQCDSPGTTTVTSSSCLEKSLRRLQENMQLVRRSDNADQERFQTWVSRWSERRSQIAERLELIDTKLEQLNQVGRPHFTVVAKLSEQ